MTESVIALVTFLAAYFTLFTLYYRRRRTRNSGVKDRAALVFTDLAERLDAEYRRVDQSPSSLYAYAGLGVITGRTATLTYEVGCLTRGFEDVGGRLSWTGRPAGDSEAFDVPRLGMWSSWTSRRRDSVRALLGRRYAERVRPDLAPTLVALAGMSFALQVRPTVLTVYAPPEVYDWPERLDNEAAACWVRAVTELAEIFPRRTAPAAT